MTETRCHLASALAPPQKPHSWGTSRAWCFTIHEPTPSQFERFSTLPQGVKYLIYQRERTPTTNRLHLQGYLICDQPVRIGGIKRILGVDSAHVEPRRGTHLEAKEYCSKCESREPGSLVVELGREPVGGGHRSDLTELAADIRAGRTELDLFERHPLGYLRYARSIERARGLYSRGRSAAAVVTVLWGDTGTGKTRAAFDRFPDAYWLPPANGGTIWWPGYDGESTVIVDEFGAGGWPLTYWLTVCDRYPLRVQTKGSHLKLAATRFVFTSNLSPMDWYPNAGQRHREALIRRLTNVVKFSDGGKVNVQRGEW